MFDRDLTPWVYEVGQVPENRYLAEWLAVATASFSNHQLYQGNRAAWRQRVLGPGYFSEYEARQELVKKYAWAIPCEAALAAIAELGPIVEIGAGTGYWVSLLRRRGVDIRAFDRAPPPSSRNHWHAQYPAWTEVEEGGPEQAALFPDRTLFLCWPPYSESMATDCLIHYGGQMVIVVGEGDGGCTADEEFFRKLDAEWVNVRDVTIPQYKGTHDYLSVWSRKEHTV